MPFTNPVMGGANLVREVMQSPNFVHDVSGWQIARDGSAEFNDLTIRGTINGLDYIINASGVFFYSPSEGAGNLVMALAAAAGSDQYGNTYTEGLSFSAGSGSPVIQVRPDLKAVLIYAST